jgi:hypothetical protein
MRTRIISAFPGTGKTTFYESNKGSVIDSDSSNFSWVIEDVKKIRNPDFPQNYINHILENIGKYEFILVSSHKVVREALINNCIFFYLVYPNINRKEEYLKRYKDRGNAAEFVKLLNDNWDNWVRECCSCNIGCNNIRMTLNNYLNDEIQYIIDHEW